jgi:16S rRNA G1207 methylase RsmC
MGIRDFIKNLGEKQRERKAMINEMQEQARAEKIVQERFKSADQRELERYRKEDFEKQIKIALEKKRKERDAEFNYGHNPLNAKNVTGKTQWEVLREGNQFANQKNMFSHQKNIFKNNKRCY